MTDAGPAPKPPIIRGIDTAVFPGAGTAATPSFTIEAERFEDGVQAVLLFDGQPVEGAVASTEIVTPIDEAGRGTIKVTLNLASCAVGSYTVILRGAAGDSPSGMQLFIAAP
jgi:hypothetical protein